MEEKLDQSVESLNNLVKRSICTMYGNMTIHIQMATRGDMLMMNLKALLIML